MADSRSMSEQLFISTEIISGVEDYISEFNLNEVWLSFCVRFVE